MIGTRPIKDSNKRIRGGNMLNRNSSERNAWRRDCANEALIPTPREPFLELSEEAKIVCPELTNIVDGVPKHRDAFRSHTEGESAKFGRIVTTVA